MNKKPLIGVILDEESGGNAEGKYSDYPYYALRKNYFDSVAKAGGTPIALPYQLDEIVNYLDLIDGLLVAGGNFDISPEMYGEDTIHESVKTKPLRTQFEFGITRKALELDMPVLGICGGEQLIAVVLGATLVQDIPSEIENCLEHEIKNRESAAHPIKILEGSMLHKMIGKTELGVNTSHHQSVKNVGEHLIASAHTSDGVVEAIESTKHKYCFGTQWHPEYLFNNEELNIFTSFVDSCK